MTNGAIFLLQDDQSLVELREQSYDSEELLQKLLADYPQLLAGEQVNRSSPRRWLLVQREAGVPSRLGGPDQWAIDHLFLDQDGIPTIIEVKRSTDTRIRREVVGQILDYAANAVAYWPIERIQAMLEESNSISGSSVEERIRGLVGDAASTTGDEVENFWQSVQTNLQAGRVRMVFVADVIPPELQRIVEFLNGQMQPAEVIAVEIRQYVGRGARTLVPRVFGLTADAQAKQNRYRWVPGETWNLQRFLDVLNSKQGEASTGVVQNLLESFEALGWQIAWGRRNVDGSCQLVPFAERPQFAPFKIWSYGTVEVSFGAISASFPFDTQELRGGLRTKLAALPDLSLPQAVDKYPSFPLLSLAASQSRETFVLACEWLKDQIAVQVSRLGS